MYVRTLEYIHDGDQVGCTRCGSGMEFMIWAHKRAVGLESRAFEPRLLRSSDECCLAV